MPKTKLGKWAVALMAVFFISLLIVLLFINVIGLRRGSVETVAPGIIMMIAGVATFITGAVSLFKFKDRAALVILATVFGSLAVLIALMEIVEIITHSLN
jgi:hypothetical protein